MPDPQRIAHFRIEGRLGVGGMGVVFRATDEALRRVVAIKVLPLGFEADEDRRARFLREARAAAALNHPNLATIFEIGEAEGRIYIAMEHCPGITLKGLLASRRLSVDEALTTAVEVARALAHAHAAGIIHRDLKPDNIMVAPDGRVKVLDFGLAKQTAREDVALEDLETMTETGQFLGTPAYVSPEQSRGDTTLSLATDVFSFGVILYEMLTGRRPFDGASLPLILQAVATREPRPASEINPGVSVAVDAVLGRCLAKNPADRIPDGEILVDTLSSLPRTVAHPRVSTGPRPWRLSRRALAMVALASLSLAAPLGLRALDRSTSTPPSEAAAPGASPAAPADASSRGRPLTLLDHPPPSSSSPEALAHYRTALRDLRNGSVGHALGELAEALALDPTFPAALMRFGFYPGLHVSRLREALRFADKLDARDLAILRALEPLVSLTPDDHECVVRLRALAVSNPGDVEVLVLLAMAEGRIDLDRERVLVAQAAALDPGMAYGEVHLAASLRRFGATAEALEHFDACARISPFATSCIRGAARARATLGDCAGYARGSIASIQAEGTDYWAHLAVLDVRLHGTSAYEEASAQLERALHTPFARTLGEPQVANVRFSVDHAVRLWFGDLDAARRDPRPLARIAEVGDVATLIDAQEEAGDGKAALALARAYLAARGGDAVDLREITEAPTGQLWNVRSDGLVLRILRKYRALPEEQLTRIQTRWAHATGIEVTELTPFETWLELHAEPALEATQARAAFAVRPVPGGADDIAVHRAIRDQEPLQWERLGRLHLLAHEPALAAPWLERAATSCIAIDGNVERSYVAAILHARHELALAREQLGDIPAACAAHASVLERWGNATPRSVTADASRARMKALACP